MKEKNERKKTNRKGEKGRRKGVKNRVYRDVGARAGIGTGTGLTMVAIALALCVFAQSVLAAQISVDPECQIVTKGDYFTVDIYADPEGNETVAGSYNLYFNNTLLNATYQVNGTFLSQDGAPTDIVTNETNNTLGVVNYGEYRQVSYGVTNLGVLATITFEALADGFCEFCLGDWETTKTELVDVNLTPIPTDVNNGSVRIGICGDVNGDDSVSISDAYAVVSNTIHTCEWAADVNCDCAVSITDAYKIVSHNLNCCCDECWV